MLLKLVVLPLVAACASMPPPPLVQWPVQPVRAMPLVQNFIGSANLIGPQRLVETVFIGLGPITAAPFNGNFQNSSILFNGAPMRVVNTSWTPCEGNRSSADVINRVRMPYRQRSILQQWSTSRVGGYTLLLHLDGPYFRKCDEYDAPAPGNQPCGWGTPIPADRAHFTHALVPPNQVRSIPAMLTSDTLTTASAAAGLWVTGPSCTDVPLIEVNPVNRSNCPACSGYFDDGFNATVVLQPGCTLWHAISWDHTDAGALDGLASLLADVDTSWNDACEKWNAHYQSAYNTSNTHFSGNLPSIEAFDNASARVRDLFGWAASAYISLERVSYRSFPRVFVISEGPSNAYDGSFDMGGSGQFVWDLSFAAVTASLLDPVATRVVLQHVVGNADFSTKPISTVQSWDMYWPLPNAVPGGIYCFDFVATFLFLQTYATVTGDIQFLTSPVQNNHDISLSKSPLDLMRELAWNWKHYPSSTESPFLADYGSNKRDFLEAVTTYTDVIAALQAGNAGMLLSLARLLETIDPVEHATEIKDLRSNATAIVDAMVRFQYVPTSGSWKCLKANNSSPPSEVKCLADTIYVGLAWGLLAKEDAARFPLPHSVRAGMSSLFETDFLANGWVRAMSLNDPSMSGTMCKPSNCSVEDVVQQRSDWTATGGYGGLPGAAVDAVASLDMDLSRAIAALLNFSIVTDLNRGTMPSQGMGVLVPPFMRYFLNDNDGVPNPQQAFAASFPEMFDEVNMGYGSTWPHSMRTIQNAEASLVDAVVRSIFGWRPDWNTTVVARTDMEKAVTDSLWLPQAPRKGFNATLRHLRTPFGRHVDVHADSNGLRWQWSHT